MGGNIVGVQHENNVWSYYAHLSTAKVQKGDKVDPNTAVGTVGNTGNPGNPSNPLKTQEGGRTWPHLHFGVKEHGSWVDPSKFFNIPQYDADYAKNPNKYQKFWASDTAKQEAEAFSMKDHVSKRRVAFSNNIDRLMKIAFEYARIAKKI
jgi:murein DD-endopeptidase MepM/ murein hydrolase activator NlpD